MTSGDQPNTHRQRHELREEDRTELARLLALVPTETRIYTLWTSNPGQEFLRKIVALRDSGVPVRWMAEAIKLDERVLTSILKHQRERETRHRR